MGELLMRRLVVVALLGAATLFASTAGAHGSRPMRHGRPCHRLYTVAMARRAARAVYAGTRHATRAERHMLGRLARCQRNPRASKAAGRLERAEREAWSARRADAAVTPFGPWAIPAYIVQCESGGENLPPNSASASGYYQILSSTWASYGGGEFASQAYLSSKFGQDVVAGRIWREAGAGQWVCA